MANEPGISFEEFVKVSTSTSLAAGAAQAGGQGAAKIWVNTMDPGASTAAWQARAA